MARVINKVGFTDKKEFIGKILLHSYEDLTLLDVPQGVQHLYCDHNKLTALIVPEGAKSVECSDNNLRKLVLPDGLRSLDATNNPQLKSIKLPTSLLWCNLDPATEIENIEEIEQDTDMNIRYIATSQRDEWRDQLRR